MQAGWYTYLQSQAVSLRLTTPGDWQSEVCSQHEFVDALPGYTVEMVAFLMDYLASECRLSLPLSHIPSVPSTAPSSTMLVGIFNSHDLQFLKTRLHKRNVHLPATEVFRLYGERFPGEADLDQDWTGFLLRQSAIPLDEQATLVMVVSDRIADLM